MLEWIDRHRGLSALIAILACAGLTLGIIFATTGPDEESTPAPEATSSSPPPSPTSTAGESEDEAAEQAIRQVAQDYVTVQMTMSWDDDSDSLDELKELATEEHFAELAAAEEFAPGTLSSDMEALRMSQSPTDFDIRVSSRDEAIIALVEFRLRTQDVNGSYSSQESLTLRLRDTDAGPRVEGMNVQAADREVFEDYLGGQS